MAGIGIIQMLANLAGNLMMNPVYAVTLHFFKGSVFLLGAFLHFIGIITMM